MKYVLALLVVLSSACAAVKPSEPAAEKIDPTERTTWDICVGENWKPVELPPDEPPYQAPCKAPQKLRYASRPVPLYSYGPEPIAGVLGRSAALQWNAWLGFEVFVYTDEDVPDNFQSGVIVYVPTPSELVLGQAFPVKTESSWVCVAGVLVTDVNVYRTATHEVGHCLGLSHDSENKGSIMYPYSMPGPYKVTAADRAALRKLYAIR